LIRDLVDQGARLAVSATTRDARDGETNGVDYHFVDRDRFIAMRDAGELLEWAEVHGRLYGTPGSEVAADSGDEDVVLLDIDVHGYRSIRALGIDVLGVFIAPPSMDELIRRLQERKSESEAARTVRLENAATEMAARHEYDHIVVNDDVDQAKKQLRELVLIRNGSAT
jgi:guanylate kinase